MKKEPGELKKTLVMGLYPLKTNNYAAVVERRATAESLPRSS
jgi:hypothetical protein